MSSIDYEQERWIDSCLDRFKPKLPKSPLTYVLFCVFGIGSWIAVNGVWSEISILTLTLPECYKLAAILVVAIQIANVGPLLYTIAKYIFQRCGWDSKQIHLERVAVTLIVAIGVAACVLLAVFWDRTAVLRGSVQSVALIVLTFFLALVDCTSSVVFIPFMKHFPEEYISALYIGEGLSGVLPSAVALSQGFVNNSLTCEGSYPGHNALGIHFSPNIFFIFLAVMMLICGLAFLAINVLPSVRKHMVPYKYRQFQIKGNSRANTPAPSDANLLPNERGMLFGNDDEDDEEEIMADSEGGERSVGVSAGISDHHHHHLVHVETELSDNDEDTPPPSLTPPPTEHREIQRDQKIKGQKPSLFSIASSLRFQSNDGKMSNKKSKIETRVASGLVLTLANYKTVPPFSFMNVVNIVCANLTILVCLAVLNFITNGVLSALSPYVFGPYGNEVYHLAINLALLANPVMSLFYALVPFKSRVITAVMTAIALLLGIYILICAFLTPHPPLYDHIVGKLIIVSFTLFL